MNNSQIALSFLQQLKTLQNPTRALWDQGYHKSVREHWGVSAPQSTQLVRSFCKNLKDEELLNLATALWQTEIFDAMACTARILALPRLKIFNQIWAIITQFLEQIDGWALEDLLAPAAWKCLLADPTKLDEVETWTAHPNFWKRRAALVYTLPFAKPGQNPERMLKWMAAYAKDPEWFIQKAIGWWLRVLGKHNPEQVVQFLNQYGQDLKGVSKKEATRKLSHEWLEKIYSFY